MRSRNLATVEQIRRVEEYVSAANKNTPRGRRAPPQKEALENDTSGNAPFNIEMTESN